MPAAISRMPSVVGPATPQLSAELLQDRRARLHNFAQERNWTPNLQLGTMLFVLEFEGWTGGSMKFQQIR
jgi:hypothetical protein